MKNNKDFLNLSIEDFTFAILGRDTSHFANDVDEWFNIDNFGYKEVAKYLKYASDNWDEDILKAIKDDMKLAFENFMFCSTSVATPAELERGVKVERTVPEHIIWINENGKQCDMSYDGEEIYCDYELFDCIPIIDAHRESIGLPSLRTLELNHFKWALAAGIHDLFVRWQRKHFECHTLYTYAMELINRHLESQIIAEEEALAPGSEQCGTLTPDELQPPSDPGSSSVMVCHCIRSVPEIIDTQDGRNLFDELTELGCCECSENIYRWKKSVRLFGYFVKEANDLLGIRRDNNRLRWDVFKKAFSMSDAQINEARNYISKLNLRQENEPEGYEIIKSVCRNHRH